MYHWVSRIWQRDEAAPVAERMTHPPRALHFHQNTEQEPSAFSRRRILPSAVKFCLRPKGSVSNNESFSEIGPISCFETARGGLIRLGSDCKREKMLVFARPTMRWCTSRRESYSGQSVSRYLAAMGSTARQGSSISMHSLAKLRSVSTFSD